MISTTSGPRSATQRKRQRLDQLVGRIAHLVGSAPIGRIATNSAIVNSLNTGVACVGPLVVSKNKTNQRLHQHRNSNNNNNNNNHHHNNAIRHTHHNNNNNNSGVGVGESDRDDRIVIDQQRGQRICVSLSEEEEEEEEDDEDDNDDDEEEEEEVSVSMESSAGSGESPSPQQQPVMSRLIRRGNLRHFSHHHLHHHHHHIQHLHPHHGGGQVFSFDHVVPAVMAAMTGAASNGSAVSQSDEEGEEEVFSPGLGLTPTFSDRLTLSPCSQSSTTVDSPSGISFSPLSFADCPDDPTAAASAVAANATASLAGLVARGITRSLTSDPSTPLNLSTGKHHGLSSAITPPHASSSPFHATTLGCPPVGTPLGTPLANADNVELSNRRRARSDSDLCDNERLVGQTSSPVAGAVSPAAPASWVLTPATSTSLTSPPQSQQQQQHQQQAGSNGTGQHHSGHLAPRLSRLEHLRPPPLMVSLKRNSSDSTDSSWSPLFGQQESPVDLSVRSASSVSSDSPNQTSTNTSTGSVSSSELSAYSVGGLETPPPPPPPSASMSTSTTSSSSSSASSRLGKSRGSRLKGLTRSLSLSQYLSAEYLSSSIDLSGPDGEAVSPVMAAPILLPGSNPGFGCEICGQIFDQHDRLVKHLASRHKLTVQHQHQNLQHPHQPQQQQQQLQRATAAVNGGSADSGVVVKGYQCDVCQRPFARSDMLTRHMRLHTGLKPYTCRICGQVFSRSDHLSTHQRTHTGEKPYRCPQCSYAACRRDMITRHLRTHTRSEDLDGLSDPRKDSG